MAPLFFKKNLPVRSHLAITVSAILPEAAASAQAPMPLMLGTGPTKEYSLTPTAVSVPAHQAPHIFPEGM